MSKTKKRILLGSAIVILILFGGYVTLDWALFILTTPDYGRPVLTFSRTMKLVASFLCALIAVMTGKDGFDHRDAFMLRLVFTAIFSADIIFYFDFVTGGILAFAVSQCLIIVRLAAGMSMKAIRISRAWAAGSGLAIAAIDILLLVFVFYKILGPQYMALVIGYTLFLSISLWLAWMALRTDFFPRRNAFLIAAGMTCFFIGDITVGLNTFMQPGIGKAIASYMTWIFYTPAIFMLAISGYRYE